MNQEISVYPFLFSQTFLEKVRSNYLANWIKYSCETIDLDKEIIVEYQSKLKYSKKKILQDIL